MSAHLFTRDVNDLTERELVDLKDKLIKLLAVSPNIDNKFECDQWLGRDFTLVRVCARLFEMYTPPSEKTIKK